MANEKSVNLLSGDTSFETGVEIWHYAQTCNKPKICDTDGFDGNCSLLIDGEPLFSRYYFKLIKSNQDYVLSFYAKSTNGGVLTVSCLDGWDYLGNGNFQITNTWQRFSLTISPQQSDRNVWFVMSPKTKVKILVDCFQLEKGSIPTQYRQCDNLVIHTSTDTFDEVYSRTDGELSIKTVIYNSDFTSYKKPNAKLTVKSSPDAKIIFTAEKDITFDKCGRDFWNIMLSLDNGYYPYCVTFSDGDEVIAEKNNAFIVLPDDFDTLDRDFFGIHSSRVNVEAQRRIGVGWVRFAAPLWMGIESQKDTLTPFETPDWHSMGIKRLTGIVGISCPPGWAKTKNGLPIDENEIKNFARFVIDTVDLDTDCYEMENEPDLTMVSSKNVSREEGAESFAKMSKAISEQVHAKGGKLLFNISGGGHDAFDFTRKVLNKAPDAFDCFGPHLYAWPRYLGKQKGQNLSTPESGDFVGSILSSLEIIKEYGNKMELSIGEYGYALDCDENYDGFYADMHAAMIVRSFLLAKSVSEMKRIFYFTDYYTVEDRYCYGLWKNDVSPLPAAAGYATCVRMIGGCGCEKILFGPNYYLLKFTKKGHFALALWNACLHSQNEHLILDIQSDGICATTMLGSAIPATENIIKIDISAFPLFFKGDKDSIDNLSDFLIREINKVETYQISPTRSKLQSVQLNISPSESLTEIHNDILCISLGDEEKSVPIQVIPKETTQIDINFQSLLPLGTLNMKIRSQMTGKSTDYILKSLFVAEKFDGDFLKYDLNGCKNALILKERRDITPPDTDIGWKGPDDLSAKIVFLWDADNFYVIAYVTDDIHEQPFDGSYLYQGDCLQIGFDMGNDGESRGYDTLNDYEYGIALKNDGTETVWCWVAPNGFEQGAVDIKKQVLRSNTSTEYRVAFPWKMLNFVPDTDKIFGISIAVNDNDGNGVRFHLQTDGGVIGVKRPDNFSKLLLL